MKTFTTANCSAFGGLWLVLAASVAGPPSKTHNGRPADALLRLVPPDSAVVLTVDGLRDQFHAFTASSLYKGLQQLPAVRRGLSLRKRNSSVVRATRSRPFSGPT